MRTEIVYFILPEELDGQLQYKFVCESMCCSKWSTTKLQNQYKAEFDDKEQEICNRIYHKCRKWYLRNFPTDEVEISQSEMRVWEKLIKFLVETMVRK